MTPKEYRTHDATSLAELVRTKQVTAAELLEIALDLTKQNARLNFIAVPMTEIARKRAKTQLTGPFAGVPFLLKDWNQEYAGQPVTAGSAARKDWIADRNSAYTDRCLEAGLVIFGRTTTPELCIKAVTESRFYGPTRNPWDIGRTPGGSSGGSAASVAAGILPMAAAPSEVPPAIAVCSVSKSRGAWRRHKPRKSGKDPRPKGC